MEDLSAIFQTFPDHFHNGSIIEPSIQPTIRNVLDYVAQQLIGRNKITGVDAQSSKTVLGIGMQ